MSTDEAIARAQHHAHRAEQLLGFIDFDKALQRGDLRDPRDGHAGAAAGAHAALALYYQQQTRAT
jgi:hypothetical protein